MMDEIMFKLDSLRLLPLILEERKELDWAQDRLRNNISYPLECIGKSKLFLMKELSSFLDLVINERVVEPQGDYSYTWELWEYVDAIELCDRRTTEYEDITTDLSPRDYQLVERRRKRTVSKKEDTYFETERQFGVETERTVVIGSAANLINIDNVLNWPG